MTQDANDCKNTKGAPSVKEQGDTSRSAGPYKLTDLDLAYMAAGSYRKSTHEVDGIEFYVEDTNEAIVIAFRGTQADDLNFLADGFRISHLFKARKWAKWFSGARDVIRDLRIFPSHSKELNGRFHRGFLRSAEKAFALAQLPKDRPIYITGHSLGAATGLLFAGLLEHAGYEVRKFVGFGTPRVGYRSSSRDNFAQRLIDAGTTIRLYRNGKDLVTTVPCTHNHLVRQTQLGDLDPKKNWSWRYHPAPRYIDALERLGL